LLAAAMLLLSACQSNETFPAELQPVESSQAMALLPDAADLYLAMDLRRLGDGSKAFDASSLPASVSQVPSVSVFSKFMDGARGEDAGSVAVAAWLPAIPSATQEDPRVIIAWKTPFSLERGIEKIEAELVSNPDAFEGMDLQLSQGDIGGQAAYQVEFSTSSEGMMRPTPQTLFLTQLPGVILVSNRSDLLAETLNVGKGTPSITESADFQATLANIDQSAFLWFVLQDGAKVQWYSVIQVAGFVELEDGVRSQFVAAMTSPTAAKQALQDYNTNRDAIATGFSQIAPWLTELLDSIDVTTAGEKFVVQAKISQRLIDRIRDFAQQMGAGGAPARCFAARERPGPGSWVGNLSRPTPVRGPRGDRAAI
jgi:hypothetical protein